MNSNKKNSYECETYTTGVRVTIDSESKWWKSNDEFIQIYAPDWSANANVITGDGILRYSIVNTSANLILPAPYVQEYDNVKNVCQKTQFDNTMYIKKYVEITTTPPPTTTNTPTTTRIQTSTTTVSSLQTTIGETPETTITIQPLTTPSPPQSTITIQPQETITIQPPTTITIQPLTTITIQPLTTPSPSQTTVTIQPTTRTIQLFTTTSPINLQTIPINPRTTPVPNSSCVVNMTCGDSIKESDEGCDDGNRNIGDGCDQNCLYGIHVDMCIVHVFFVHVRTYQTSVS